MEQKKIERINELSHKAKGPERLTDAEKAEQAALHREYISAVRGNLKAQLDNTWVVDGQGNRTRLSRRGGKKQHE